MPDELETPFEFHAGVTELRDNLGYTVRQVALTGNAVIVCRYGKPKVAIIPLDEWRHLKSIETSMREGGRSLLSAPPVYGDAADEPE